MRREPSPVGTSLSRTHVEKVLHPLYQSTEIPCLLPLFQDKTLLAILAGSDPNTHIARRSAEILASRELSHDESRRDLLDILAELLRPEILVNPTQISERQKEAFFNYLHAAYNLDRIQAQVQGQNLIDNRPRGRAWRGDDPLVLLYGNLGHLPSRCRPLDARTAPWPLSEFLPLVHAAIPEVSAGWELRRRLLLLASIGGLGIKQIIQIVAPRQPQSHLKVRDQLAQDWARIWDHWLVSTAEPAPDTERNKLCDKTDPDINLKVTEPPYEEDGTQ